MAEISHQGKIIKINGKKICVAVNRGEMCNHCLARGSCRILSEQTQIIEAESADSQTFSLGEDVCVTTANKNGMKALFMIYAVPLIIFLALVIIGSYLKWNENKTALISVFSVIIYFLGLWIFHRKLEQKIKFYVTKS